MDRDAVGGQRREEVLVGAVVAERHDAASVTLVDEASSRFFRSREDSCFTRVGNVTPLDGGASYRIEGELYCIGALAAVGAQGSVALGDSAYAGRFTPGREEP